MNKINQITLAIEFRLKMLKDGLNVLENSKTPVSILLEHEHRIDELESLLYYINKEITK
jgi:hypothetical protein